MRMSLEIVAPGKQGLPSAALPYQAVPKSVTALQGGGVIYKGEMAQLINIVGAETYQGRYSAKWSESNPLAAISDGHTYGGTPAPTDTLARITVTAFELDQANLANGAVRLRNLISWLAFCTQPWTKLGQPPLLRLAFGFFEGYVYLTDFDPQVTEWMHDDHKGEATGLPYEATFSLTFKREPLGLAALELHKGLPSSQGAPGGAGGIGAGKVNLPQPAGTTNAVSQAKKAIQSATSETGAALKAALPFGGR